MSRTLESWCVVSSYESAECLTKILQLMSSGVVLNDDIKWISFHSGYDFGYLLKVLTCKPLPVRFLSSYIFMHG